MNDDLNARVLALDERGPQVFLTSLISGLTVSARDHYPHIVNRLPLPENYDAPQLINELIHGVIQQLRNHVSGEPLRISDEMSLEMMFERADSGIQGELEWAIRYALGDLGTYNYGPNGA